VIYGGARKLYAWVEVPAPFGGKRVISSKRGKREGIVRKEDQC
jgi:hypothetical protein